MLHRKANPTNRRGSTVVTAVLFLVVLLLPATTCTAYDAYSFHRACQLSKYVVIADIADAHSAMGGSSDTTIYTYWTLSIVESIKGRLTVGDSVEVRTYGGSVGGLIALTPGSQRPEIGDRYLLFLVRTPDNLEIHWTDLMARVDGDSTTIFHPAKTRLAWAAVRDSVAGIVAGLAPVNQSADVVVCGTFDTDLGSVYADSPSRFQSGIDDARFVVSEVVRAAQVRVSPGDTLAVRFVPQGRRRYRVAERPFVSQGDTTLVFLDVRDGMLELGDGVYSAWTKVGRAAIVRASSVMTGFEATVVDSADWDTVLRSASGY